jgi:hypothetical protein
LGCPQQGDGHPEEEKAIQEAIQREIDDRTTANGRTPEYVVIYWPPSQERGEDSKDTPHTDGEEFRA